MKFNEDSRVKIPSILHLTRLGYKYVSLKDIQWDNETNIFKDIFFESIKEINSNDNLDNSDIARLYDDISLLLDNDDLGKAFYKRLITKSGIKLIDFDNFENNTFNVVTELTYKNGDDEFRPDIILLINGIPLVFIEVKKPNNKNGVLAERTRINHRFSNNKFKKFMNITQLMIFSNNMEYDDTSPEPIEGAFYAAPAKEPIFNYFREEEKLNIAKLLQDIDENTEDFILKDNNLEVIKYNPEFIVNKEPNTPTNRLSTSLLSKDRLSFILQYAIAYVNGSKGIQKHIMRYPQIFATKAIVNKLNDGVKKGIIWHTQGSGKTALAFYNVKHLTDYFSSKKIIPKFYFIVDRIDLLIQAHREFTSRDLIVNTISSREEFAKDIKKTTALHNESGNPEITVVNIQKFKDDSDVIKSDNYDINIQRIYFLDEVHRSYNPKGSFLANLTQSDPNAIKIGLTGTPLLGDDYNSRTLFGNYIHKYYYNSSIKDGYTLRLIREEIETSYKLELKKILEDLKILEGEISRKQVYSHHNFVEPMLEYIVKDFEKARLTFDDSTIGAMVICDSADQAKMMFEIFNSQYNNNVSNNAINSNSYTPSNEASEVAFDFQTYRNKKINQSKVKTSALILHDIGTKDERKQKIEEFKDGKIDIIFVFNMLLTGFDAPRFKKLYLGRLVKSHNLLQSLTRVNRTYKKFRYGYVVDFADISKEFEATNQAYFKELQNELGDEMESYSSLFKTEEEIKTEILDIKNVLFDYDITNAEVFSQQISQIQDIKIAQNIKKVLEDSKNLYNLIRLSGRYELLENIDFKKLNKLYIEISNHIEILNQKNALEQNDESANLLNYALEDIIFKFTKIGEEELKLADELKSKLKTTRESFQGNFDKKDPEFISLKEELERLFKKKNLSDVSSEEMNLNITALNKIDEKIKELNRKNNLILVKYNNDKKYVRIHKRVIEKGGFTKQQSKIYQALVDVKDDADKKVLNNSGIIQNENYFEGEITRSVINRFKKDQKIDTDSSTIKYIGNLITNEYINEYNGELV
jgi:type I restriction enzyme R subunit